MTFVFPFLLGGLLLAGLPVLLHFLRRQQPKPLVFPAFLFLIQKERTNTRSLRLRHWLLLLLRMAIIALICLALARPRLLHESFGISREKPVAMVLIFDTTPSMDYKHGETTRLDLVKSRALELLEPLPDDCKVLILDAGDPSSFGREDWLPSLEKARQRIAGLTSRAHSVPIGAAVTEARRRFDALEDDKLPRFLCIFSDRTRPSWDVSAFAAHSADAPGTKVLYFDVGIETPADLAITQIEFPRGSEAFVQGEDIELRARVVATGQAVANTLIFQVGAREVRQAFDAEPGKPLNLTFRLSASEWKLAPGTHQAEFRFESAGDALAFNNRRFVTFAVQNQPRILVLADDVKKVERFTSYLRALLYDVDTKAVGAKVNYQDFDAVFLVGGAAPTDALWSSLQSYVESGRGLCVVPGGDEMSVPAYNSEPALKVLPARVIDKVTANPGSAWNIDANDLQHPFMHPFRSWIERGAPFLAMPRRARAYWEVAKSEDKSVTVPVEYDDDKGRPAVVERTFARSGKVLLLTTPLDQCDPPWNNYEERIAYFQFALPSLCAKRLVAPQSDARLNFTLGRDAPTLAQPAGLPKVTLNGPDAPAEIAFEKDRWNGDRLTRPGHYSVVGANPDTQTSRVLAQFSFNIAPEESDLTRVPKSEVEAVFGVGSVIAQDQHTPLLDTIADLWSEPIELFSLIMVLVLILLALEGVLANRLYRQAPADP